MAKEGKKRNILRKALKKLPQATASQYEDKISDLIESESVDAARKQLEIFEQIVKDTGECPDVRFGAYFALQTYLWRQYEYEEFRRKVKEFAPNFANHPLFSHQCALYHFSYTDIHHLDEALKHARNALEAAPEVPGVMNLFAEIFAEKSEQYPDCFDNDSDDLRLAIEAINSAIQTNAKYAKHYANRARLLALKGQFPEAYSDIRQAVELEPLTDDSVYPLRIARYEQIKAKIDLRRENDDMKKRQDEVVEQQNVTRDEMRGMRSQTLQMVGLLAAVVAFIVTGFDIATDYTPLQAAALIGVLAGTLLVVFTGFGELTRYDASIKMRTIAVASIAIALIGLSVWMLWMLQ